MGVFAELSRSRSFTPELVGEVASSSGIDEVVFGSGLFGLETGAVEGDTERLSQPDSRHAPSPNDAVNLRTCLQIAFFVANRRDISAIMVR